MLFDMILSLLMLGLVGFFFGQFINIGTILFSWGWDNTEKQILWACTGLLLIASLVMAFKAG